VSSLRRTRAITSDPSIPRDGRGVAGGAQPVVTLPRGAFSFNVMDGMSEEQRQRVYDIENEQRAQEEAQRAESAALNDRFGNDLAFLDPMFKQEAALLGQSRTAQAQADPQSIAAQRAALDQLMGIAQGGGATALERSRMQRARKDQEGWLRGQREADMQNLAERGMSGSGAELTTLAMDRQAAAGRLSQADLDTEAMLEQRAMEAVMAGGNLASGMRGQSFNEGTTRAKAQDEFSILNQNALNEIGGQNKQFLQDAWQRTIDRRNQWDQQRMQLGLNTAGNLLDSDTRQNATGYQYAGGQAQSDANAFNDSRSQYNSTINTPNDAAARARSQADAAKAQNISDTGQLMDSYADFWMQMGGGGMPSGEGGPQSGGGSTWGSSAAGGKQASPWVGTAPTASDVEEDD
jgi:hypothetical protein